MHMKTLINTQTYHHASPGLRFWLKLLEIAKTLDFYSNCLFAFFKTETNTQNIRISAAIQIQVLSSLGFQAALKYIRIAC